MLYAGGHSCDSCLLMPGAVYSKLNFYTCLASSATFGPGLPLWFSSLKGSSWFPYSIVCGFQEGVKSLGPCVWASHAYSPEVGHLNHTCSAE